MFWGWPTSMTLFPKISGTKSYSVWVADSVGVTILSYHIFERLPMLARLCLLSLLGTSIFVSLSPFCDTQSLLFFLSDVLHIVTIEPMLSYDEVLTFLLDAEELLGIYGLDVPDLSLPAAHQFDT